MSVNTVPYYSTVNGECYDSDVAYYSNVWSVKVRNILKWHPFKQMVILRNFYVNDVMVVLILQVNMFIS